MAFQSPVSHLYPGYTLITYEKFQADLNEAIAALKKVDPNDPAWSPLSQKVAKLRNISHLWTEYDIKDRDELLVKRNDQDYAQNSGRFRVGVDLPGIIKKRRKEMEAAEKALKKAEKQQRKKGTPSSQEIAALREAHELCEWHYKDRCRELEVWKTRTMELSDEFPGRGNYQYQVPELYDALKHLLRKEVERAADALKAAVKELYGNHCRPDWTDRKASFIRCRAIEARAQSASRNSQHSLRRSPFYPLSRRIVSDRRI